METHAMLLSFESRLESLDALQISPEGSSSINFTSQTRKRGYNNQTSRGRGNSSFQPHRERGGRAPFRGREGRHNGGLRCQICFRTNHTTDKCFYRADLNYVPNNSTVNYAQSNTHPALNSHIQGNSLSNGFSSNSSSVNMTSGNQMDFGPDNNWYPDSGASNHVTYDIGNLSIASDFHGDEKVHVGNGAGPSNRHHPA